MERKRKLPPRAAARVESASKKRNTTTTPESPPPAPASPQPPPEPAAREPSPAPALPTSLQPGQPLPTVEEPQPDELPIKDYQSIPESGVLAESLSRARMQWLDGGVFEKYWTKPSKRKGVVKEDPNNPPKESMTKIGTATLICGTLEFHPTLYAVKDMPKAVQTTSSAVRPILQYGPPNGVMPTASTTNGPDTPSAPTAPVSAASSTTPRGPPVNAATPTELRRPSLPTSSETSLPPSRGLEGVLAPPSVHGNMPSPGHSLPSQPVPMSTPQHHTTPQPTVPMQPAVLYPPGAAPAPASLASPAGPAGPSQQAAIAKPSPPVAKPAPASAPGADPIIVTLAEKAAEDPKLRDLMKRVAVGQAAPDELVHFQNIIDQITAEYKKRRGVSQGPAAEQMMVNGRTLKWYADEAKIILNIVLSAKPRPKPEDFRMPRDGDFLMGILIRHALGDADLEALIRRVADGKTKFVDTTDLKARMDRMKVELDKQLARQHQQTPGDASTPAAQANGEEGPAGSGSTTVSKKASVQGNGQSNASAQQALRSKGPPPMTRIDIAAVVMDFGEKSSDRYLFPKFSILDVRHGGTEILATFLLVQRGSTLTHGADRSHDFYEPITIKFTSSSPKILENLPRVVAPEEEVIRYMDDVKDNMTPADYIYIAMRLTRERRESREASSDAPHPEAFNHVPQTGVLWNTNVSPQPGPPKPVGNHATPDGGNYQSFINSIT